MSTWNLAEMVKDVPSLRGLFISIMPDALLYDSWARENEPWEAEMVAAFFGDLVRANRQGLKALSSWSADMQVTIESSDALLILKELKEEFVVAAVFDRDTPLGMVRLYVKKLIERLLVVLPVSEIAERPKAIRIIEFLQRYAPDPHAVLMRVALILGISIEQLEQPETFESSRIDELEQTAKEIMGLEKLSV